MHILLVGGVYKEDNGLVGFRNVGALIDNEVASLVEAFVCPVFRCARRSFAETFRCTGSNF